MPIKTFLQGDILTADEVNQFLMDQVVVVFADAAARDNAFGGAGEPVLTEGRFCYLSNTNSVQYYDGGQWQDAPQFSLADGIVTTAKIADSAVTSAKIADGTIVNADVSTAAAIDLGKLADATIDDKAASYTLVLADKNKFIKMNVATANTITIPTNASVAFPIGSQIHIIQYGVGKTQVIPVSGTVTVYATPGAYLRAQYSSATLLKCDTNIWLLIGDLSAS
jgi:hypothetical protein